MTTEEEKAALLAKYVMLIRPHLALAKKAYGSRDTVSPQHDASRAYTKYLCEFYAAGGSLLEMAKALDVTYAGLRRRVTTADLPASSGRARKKFPEETYDDAVADILAAKQRGTKEYHAALKNYFDGGLSMAKIATKMGLSSANPLYYGINCVEMAERSESTQGPGDSPQ